LTHIVADPDTLPEQYNFAASEISLVEMYPYLTYNGGKFGFVLLTSWNQYEKTVGTV
jgi:hypothetical protein